MMASTTMDNTQLPSYASTQFEGIDTEFLLGEKSPLKCSNCGKFANTSEDIAMSHGNMYDKNECFILSCWNRDCHRKGSWAYCKTCNGRFSSGWVISHADSDKHKRKKACREREGNKRNCSDTGEDNNNGAMIPDSFLADESIGEFEIPPGYDILDETSRVSDAEAEEIVGRIADKDDDEFMGGNNNNKSNDKPSGAQDYPLRANDTGSAWLGKLLHDVPEATRSEVEQCFNTKEERYFWISEHASPAGRCGGGLKYIVARAFAQGLSLETTMLPSFEEAIWQLDNCMQYQSMSEKQRERQSSIVNRLTRSQSSLFRNTFSPDLKQMRLLYGKNGKHSILNTLPIPKVQNFNGIAYVSPPDIIKFAFANGVRVDDIYLDYGKEDDATTTDDNKPPERVYYASDSLLLRSMLQEAKLNGPQCADAKLVVMLPMSDWGDGFNASHTKTNRKSIVAQTLSLSPEKQRVNATDNTFVFALGLKKSSHNMKDWQALERQYQQDLLDISDSSKPLKVYHGGLRKMVYVHCKRVISMQDKPERADTTYTISHASDYHRCFSKSLKVDAPNIRSLELKALLAQQQTNNANDSKWGWSNDYVVTQDGMNGARIPSCYQCRSNRLTKLGVIMNFEADTHNQVCSKCTDWTLDASQAEKLCFKPPKDYPKKANENCPVPPPTERQVPAQQLTLMDLSYQKLISAARFAFFNCSRKKGSWSKTTCLEYLRTCGLSNKIQVELYNAAKASRGVEVDYSDEEGVGDFRFPAAWKGHLPIERHIELIMHLLFLGISQSNVDLCDEFFKAAKGLGINSFRKAAQPLLRRLKKFQLSWLLAMPFSGNEKKLGTGSWVGENWLCFARLLKIVYFWADKTTETTGNGTDDLFRMIISFTAMVARLLTHSGHDKSDVAAIDLYVKEFLSCISELDLRVRHQAIARSNGGANAKGEDPWWVKSSNYFSLQNVVAAIMLIGPLVNWWDGGGKGERIIQEIKPHLSTGVRETLNFFLNLLQKIYRFRQLNYLEQRYTTQDTVGENNEESDSEDDDDDIGDDELPGAITLLVTESDSDEDNDDHLGTQQQQHSSPVEDLQMSKARTIYIYRTHDNLLRDINLMDPLAGVIISERAGGSAMYCVMRCPGRSFAWCKVSFDDTKGVFCCGIWYAPMIVLDPNNDAAGVEPCPQTVSEIQSVSQMSAVAIPLHYALGKEHPNSNKYCVITNWWKERNSNGQYRLPMLDSNLYA